MVKCFTCDRPLDLDEIRDNGCIYCLKAPYNIFEYRDAKSRGLDLDDWNDYVKYFGIGEDDDYE